MTTNDHSFNDTINEEVYDSSYEIQSWDDLNLNPKILRGIFAYGFEKPSPIQQKAIKPLIMGKDIIAQAQSGTGKTATFTIGALANVDVTNNTTQVLVLSPTRELTTQTAKVFTSLGDMMDGLRVQVLFGGSTIEEHSSFSNKNVPHVICGCTGRVYDMLRRDKITLKTLKLVILDEADEMLSSGFKEQVYNIFQYFNNNIQVALFSATLPPAVYPIINKIMRNPVRISVKREMLTLEGIRQFYIAVDDDRQKYATLKNLFSFLSVSQCIIYCNSVKRVADLFDAMKEDAIARRVDDAIMELREIYRSVDRSVSSKLDALSIEQMVAPRGFGVSGTNVTHMLSSILPVGSDLKAWIPFSRIAGAGGCFSWGSAPIRNAIPAPINTIEFSWLAPPTIGAGASAVRLN